MDSVDGSSSGLEAQKTSVAAQLWEEYKSEARCGRSTPFFDSLAAGNLSEEDFCTFLRQCCAIGEGLENSFGLNTSTSASDTVLQLVFLTKPPINVPSEVLTTTPSPTDFGIGSKEASQFLESLDEAFSVTSNSVMESSQSTEEFVQLVRLELDDDDENDTLKKITTLVCHCAAFGRTSSYFADQFSECHLKIPRPDDHCHLVIKQLFPRDLQKFCTDLETCLNDLLTNYTEVELRAVKKSYKDVVKKLASIIKDLD